MSESAMVITSILLRMVTLQYAASEQGDITKDVSRPSPLSVRDQ